MSALERKTKPLLVPLLKNARTHDLTPGEQKRLAAWGYKTGIVLSLVAPMEEHVVPLDHFKHMHDTGVAPTHTWMWVAGVQPVGRDEERSGWSQPERLQVTFDDGTVSPHFGYRLSFSLMNLFFQKIHDPGAESLDRPRELRDVFTRIRPISKGTWPPSRLLTLDALDDLRNGRFLTPQHR